LRTLSAFSPLNHFVRSTERNYAKEKLFAGSCQQVTEPPKPITCPHSEPSLEFLYLYIFTLKVSRRRVTRKQSLLIFLSFQCAIEGKKFVVSDVGENGSVNPHSRGDCSTHREKRFNFSGLNDRTICTHIFCNFFSGRFAIHQSALPLSAFEWHNKKSLQLYVKHFHKIFPFSKRAEKYSNVKKYQFHQ
jgi:hypothetical protein